MKNTERICGVYKITCRVNGHIYIGSSCNIIQRWKNHKKRLRSGTHGNSHLKFAWNLYSKDQFTFSLVEECKADILIEREQYYIDQMNPEYNIQKVAGSNAGIERTPETRARLSMAQTGKVHSSSTKAKLSVAQIGHAQTDETRAKISFSLRDHSVSEETRQKMSISHLRSNRTNRPESS